MFVIGIFITLAVIALVALAVALAVKFGVQWAILGNLPLIRSYMKGEEIDKKKQKLFDDFNLKALFSTPLVRLIFIGIICLISLIPIDMLTEVSHDRSKNAEYAVERVAQSWGEKQNVRGPAIWLPYKELTTITETVKDENDNEITKEKQVWVEKNRMFLPDDLEITANIETQTRISGIYPVPVYTAQVNISGRFPQLGFKKSDGNIIPQQTDYMGILAIGVSDMKGLKKVGALSLNNAAGEKIEVGALSGLTGGAGSGKGMHYLIPKECAQSACTFSLDLELNGVQLIDFSTTGRETKLNINSDWPHPKFYGDGLPDEKEISDKGFKANWHVGHLVRSYPQIGDEHTGMKQFDEYKLGVNLMQPVNPYSMVLRSVKYALLLIGLTLIGMFVFEQAINKRLHIAQYLVTTGALSLFYLTLLSLSEHIGFLRAWITASLIIIAMVSIYVGSALKALKPAIGLAIFMGAVYTVMYALLRLEDYALLVGTGILLILMVVVMWVTRKLNQEKT